MIQLEEKFDGHIILYCKGHYRQEGVDFIEGLRRIWAVRCGLSVEHISSNFDEYITDKLFSIFKQCNPKKVEWFQDILHKGLADDWSYKNLNAIQRAMMVYVNELAQLQIKEFRGRIESKPVKGYVTLIRLPKPQKRLFKRIVSGKGEYNDYELVK